MAEPEEAELEPPAWRSPRCGMSSRDIDEEHRPRIRRLAPAERAGSRRTSRLGTVIRRVILSAAALSGAVVGAGACLWVTLPSPPRQQIALSSEFSAAPPETRSTVKQMRPEDREPGTSHPEETEDPAADPAMAPFSARDPPAPSASKETPSANLPSARPPRAELSTALRRSATPNPPRPARVVVQLSSFFDQAKAREAADTLERSLRSLLKGTPVQTERGAVRGRTVWRVVAGPVASRDRGKRLCDALHSAGRSCLVMVL